jgi:UDP-N-acetylglucosamine acyltransferase
VVRARRHVIMSNNATLAGHVLGNHVGMGGLSAIHQFCRVGDYAMIGGLAKIVQDVPPFFIVDGNPSEVRAPNKVGLERAGFTAEQLALVRSIFKTLYRMGLNHKQAMEKLRAMPEDPLLRDFITFVEGSERGIC